MALSTGQVINWGDTTPTLVSGTYTPTTPGLLVVIGMVHTQAVGPVADATSIAGNSIANVTKLNTQGTNVIATPTIRVEAWVATSTATAGTITITLPGTPTGMLASLTEINGALLSHGTLGIVQVVGVNDNDVAGTVMSLNMDTFLNPADGALAIFAAGGAPATTPKTGWTELSDRSYASPNQALETQFIATNDPQPQGTISSQHWAGITVEIAGGAPVTAAHRATLLRPQTPALLPTERLIRPVLAPTTITGTLATTNANDTSVATGTTTVTGALARTNANDTLSASGSVGSPVSGTLATTNANDTVVAVGTTKILGTSATTNANDTLSASGVVGTPVVTPPAPPQQVGGTLSGRRGPYTAVDAELEAILRDDEEILVLI